MPPKKVIINTLILKLKRQSTTYMVEIPSDQTVSELKTCLVNMINSTNGLKMDDSLKSLDENGELNVNDKIEIPNIALDESDSDSDADLNSNTNSNIGQQVDIENSEAKSASTEINDKSRLRVSNDDIVLGIFTDTNDFYTSTVEPLNEDVDVKLENLNFQDFTPIAFKYKDEKFKFYKPRYD